MRKAIERLPTRRTFSVAQQRVLAEVPGRNGWRPNAHVVGKSGEMREDGRRAKFRSIREIVPRRAATEGSEGGGGLEDEGRFAQPTPALPFRRHEMTVPPREIDLA